MNNFAQRSESYLPSNKSDSLIKDRGNNLRNLMYGIEQKPS